ncbi:hypothetical protein [uncultured Sneathiella sp.]|uniref:hypothetical protein n=1 Tax=uncultured Sneathiella sp. TaxID=879315 RepID=UPI0030EDF8FA
MNEPVIHRFVITAFAAFVVAAAIPFVPGAEIGFALLFIFGGKAAPLVYAGMVLALVIAYSAAIFLPLPRIVDTLSWLGLTKASDFVAKLANASAADREEMLANALPLSFGDHLLRNRYLVLAIALNTPGNSLLGGGGGLAFIAGKSGVFGFWPFVFTVIVAIAPVPLIFMFT